MAQDFRTHYEDRSPTDSEVDALASAGARYMELRGRAARGRDEDGLDWLARLPLLERLYISGRATVVPPESVLQRLTEFALQGPARPPLAMNALPTLAMLELRRPSDVHGLLAESGVATLRLSSHDEPDLGFVAGSSTLRSLSVWGRGQTLQTLWTSPPGNLTEIRLERVDVESLSDLANAANLEALTLWFPLSRRGGAVLDLTPLASCESLQSVAIASPVTVLGLQALRDLPSLAQVDLSNQVRFDPAEAIGVPLRQR